MKPAKYVPSVPNSQESPLFLRIARALSLDIRRGRLLPGARLPGSRELAECLGAHRNTVLAAYAELTQEGWLVAKRARGTFVAEALPEVKARPFARAEPRRERPLELPPLEFDALARVEPTALALLSGSPDPRLMPTAALARAYRRTLKRSPAALAYGDEHGDPRLLRALGELLRAARGVVAAEGELIVTRGSQMALTLAARAICRAGDVIAVEALGYSPAWAGFRLAGAELVPVPVDAGGIDIVRLTRLLETRRIAALYVTPHHQYPTTVTLSAPRRLELLALAERAGFFILEDDYDHEFHWSGRPVLPLASADPARVVIYVGTLSKLFAPGIRVGYLAARAEIVARVAALRVCIDRQGDHAVERALAELIEDGELERHGKRVYRAYSERRAVLIECLERELAHELTFQKPAGGLALWCRARTPLGVERAARLAYERGVLVQTARRFSFDQRPREYLRIGFPGLNPGEIRRAVRLLASALKASSA